MLLDVHALLAVLAGAALLLVGIGAACGAARPSASRMRCFSDSIWESRLSKLDLRAPSTGAWRLGAAAAGLWAEPLELRLRRASSTACFLATSLGHGGGAGARLALGGLAGHALLLGSRSGLPGSRRGYWSPSLPAASRRAWLQSRPSSARLARSASRAARSCSTASRRARSASACWRLASARSSASLLGLLGLEARLRAA